MNGGSIGLVRGDLDLGVLAAMEPPVNGGSTSHHRSRRGRDELAAMEPAGERQEYPEAYLDDADVPIWPQWSRR
jgi:hypothetical protein